MTLQQTIDASKELAESINRDIDGLTLPATDRDRLSAALLDQVHEHHQAIRVLLESNITGSAFSLVRILFETMVRGIWLQYCASDSDIEKFKQDRIDKSFNDIIDDVEAKFETENGALSKVKKDYWSSMCSYAHGGYLQAARRITEEHITPVYSVEEKIEAIRLADFCLVLASAVSFSMSGCQDLAEKWANSMQ